MPTLASVDGVLIKLYIDHGPPHVHLKIPGEGEVRVYFLETPLRTDRRAPRAMRAALRWVEDNRALIEQRWMELNEPVGRPPHPRAGRRRR